MCPGHEMIGVVIECGKSVKQFKVGDFAAVGNMADSCGECARCKEDEEQYCAKGFTPTYNGKCASAFSSAPLPAWAYAKWHCHAAACAFWRALCEAPWHCAHHGHACVRTRR